MIKNWFLTGFVLKILIVSCLTLTFYSSEVCATGSPPDDNAEFMSEMSEFLRHPDEPDIYPDDHLNISDSITDTQNTTPIPYHVIENAEDPGELLNTQNENASPPDNDEIRIARPPKNNETWIAGPSDPESEYPAEPDTLSGDFIDVMEELLESGWTATAGAVVIFVLAGLGIMKIRRKTAAAVGIQDAPAGSPTGSPIQKRTAASSFQTPDSKHLNQEQIKCSQCALVISANHTFCTGCGAPVPTIIEKQTHPLKLNPTKNCVSCGTTLEPDVLFCTNCGEKI